MITEFKKMEVYCDVPHDVRQLTDAPAGCNRKNVKKQTNLMLLIN